MNDFEHSDSSGSQNKTKKMLPFLIMVSRDPKTNAMDEKEYSCRKKQMKEEIEKEDLNVSNIHDLFKVTHELRMLDVKKYQNHVLHNLIKSTPAVQREDMVRINYINNFFIGAKVEVFL